MQKIPSIFLRDPSDMKHVTREANPACAWVFDGEGVPTRKYDGTCVLFDADGFWFARREVKPGKTPPPNYRPIVTDPTTGKTMGWEPIEQSAFVKFHAEALALDVLDTWPIRDPQPGATYELCGPRINGNPEKLNEHLLVRHGYEAAVDRKELESLDRSSFDGIRDWLLDHPRWEGIVFHHPDGRMAKIKGRDFPARPLGPDAQTP